MTEGEAGGTDRAIDVSFYRVASLEHEGLGQPLPVVQLHYPHRRSWIWARAGPQKLIEAGLTPPIVFANGRPSSIDKLCANGVKIFTS